MSACQWLHIKRRRTPSKHSSTAKVSAILELQAPSGFLDVVRCCEIPIKSPHIRSLMLDAREAGDVIPDLLTATFPYLEFLEINVLARSSQLDDVMMSYISNSTTMVSILNMAIHRSSFAPHPSPDASVLPSELLPRTLPSTTPIILVTVSSGRRICHMRMKCLEWCTPVYNYGGYLAGQILQAAPIEALNIQLDIHHLAFSGISSLLFPLDTACRIKRGLDSMDIHVTVDILNDSSYTLDRSLVRLERASVVTQAHTLTLTGACALLCTRSSHAY